MTIALSQHPKILPATLPPSTHIPLSLVTRSTSFASLALCSNVSCSAWPSRLYEKMRKMSETSEERLEKGEEKGRKERTEEKQREKRREKRDRKKERGERREKSKEKRREAQTKALLLHHRYLPHQALFVLRCSHSQQQPQQYYLQKGARGLSTAKHAKGCFGECRYTRKLNKKDTSQKQEEGEKRKGEEREEGKRKAKKSDKEESKEERERVKHHKFRIT